MTLIEKLIVACGFAVLGAIFILAVCSMTVFPMMANYRECGTIFLCKNQH